MSLIEELKATDNETAEKLAADRASLREIVWRSQAPQPGDGPAALRLADQIAMPRRDLEAHVARVARIRSLEAIAGDLPARQSRLATHEAAAKEFDGKYQKTIAQLNRERDAIRAEGRSAAASVTEAQRAASTIASATDELSVAFGVIDRVARARHRSIQQALYGSSPEGRCPVISLEQVMQQPGGHTLPAPADLRPLDGQTPEEAAALHSLAAAIQRDGRPAFYLLPPSLMAGVQAHRDRVIIVDVGQKTFTVGGMVEGFAFPEYGVAEDGTETIAFVAAPNQSAAELETLANHIRKLHKRYVAEQRKRGYRHPAATDARRHGYVAQMMAD